MAVLSVVQRGVGGGSEGVSRCMFMVKNAANNDLFCHCVCWGSLAFHARKKWSIPKTKLYGVENVERFKIHVYVANGCEIGVPSCLID